MAILSNGIQFTGTLGGLTAYRIKGLDKIYVKRVSAPDKTTVLNDAAFEMTRQNASEFGRCAFAAGSIRKTLIHLAHLADHNFTPRLTSLAKRIQYLDTTASRGQRAVFISKHASYFREFNLNKLHSLDTIIRHPFIGEIDQATHSATVLVPSLLPGVNLFLPWPVPQYRIVVSLGLAADQLYASTGHKTEVKTLALKTETSWLPSNQPFEGQSFTLQLTPPDDVNGYSHVLGVGIEMEIPQLKGWGGTQRIGAAKILEIG